MPKTEVVIPLRELGDIPGQSRESALLFIKESCKIVQVDEV